MLCSSHYLSAPALSWETMLYMTKVELQLISDTEMHLFFEKVMKSGVSYISQRYSKASNKYLQPYYAKQESNHIISLNANNFYSYAMSKFLPTNGFKWISPKEFDANKQTCNSSTGCALVVHLEYPKKLPELHNDCPLALDKIKIKREMMSSYQLQIADFYNFPTGVVNLLPNFFDKEKYVFHYEQLQFYLRLGLKLKKIHCVLEFNQSQSLKPYVKFNTQKRIEAGKNGVKDGKALYKLMSNAVYGKKQKTSEIELM